MEFKKNKLEEAKKISAEIKSEYNGLIEKVKELKGLNENLKDAIGAYGGLGMFHESFSFTAFDSGAVNSHDRLISDIDFPLEDYLKSNEDKISLESLQTVLDGLKDRKSKIIEALSQDFTSKEEAFTKVESIHKELILPVLNSEKVFI